MTRLMRLTMLLACTMLAAACSRTSPEASADGYGGVPAAAVIAESRARPQADTDTAQSTLAYEHDVRIALPADAIQARVNAAQEACITRKFGDCVVLQVRQQGGDHPDAAITVRIAPTGVEPMVAQASTGAEIGSRSTQAEDLAVVVRDNTLAQQRLRNERDRLVEFQQRRDLAVADMIALSKQLAETDAQLQAAEQEGAQHRRRIDTQLLTMTFSPPDAQVGRSEIGQAVRDFGSTVSIGMAWTIRAMAFLLPLIAVAWVLLIVVRRLRRGFRSRR